MERIKNYLSQWNFSRGLKFFFGVALLVFFIAEKEAFYLVFALFFLIQSVFNVGCCVAGNCKTKTSETKTTFKFKELKNK